MQNPGHVRAPSTVVEGGVVRIEVYSRVGTVNVFVSGHGITAVRVVNGVAEYALPTTVPGGAIVYITDGLYPNPSSATVAVVGGSV